MHSAINLKHMKELGMAAIMGLKKIPSIKKKFLEGLKRAEIYSNDTRVILKNTTVHVKTFPYREWELQIKGVLSLRPVRMWLKSHVNGHIRVCYITYAILTLAGLDLSPS